MKVPHPDSIPPSNRSLEKITGNVYFSTERKHFENNQLASFLIDELSVFS